MRYSVVIPYRDRPLLLNRALNSIPDREDIQIIVINNNDFPFDKECDFSREKSSVLLLQHPGGGPGGAINAAWGSIQGRLTLFLDADDCFAPGAFDVFDEYSDGMHDMVFFKSDSIDLSTGKKAGRHRAYNAVIDRYFKTYEERELRYRFGPRWAKLYRTTFLKENGIEMGEGAGGDALFSAVAGYYAGLIAVSDRVVYVISANGMVPSFTERFSADDRFNKYCMYIRKHVFLKEHGVYIADPVHIFVLKALLRYGFREANRYLVLAKDSKVSFLHICITRFKHFCGIDTLHNILRPLRHKSDKLYFEVHVTDHCNLNCASCSHFSSIAEEHFCNLDVFKRDMKRMRELFAPEEVRRITLLGGEPLLHPQLPDFIRITAELFPKSILQLITNGILLQKQTDEFWEVARNSRIRICVSRYPISLDYRQLETLLGDKRVQFKIAKASPYFRKDTVNEGSVFSAFNSWLKCQIAVRCSNLCDGKFYICSKIPYVKYFNKAFDKKVPVTERDYVDIFRPDARLEILRALKHPAPFCKHCRVDGKGSRISWSRSRKSITEWQ